MTTVMLMLALQAFLRKELARDATTVPVIHLGALPNQTEAARQDAVFPYIIIRPVEGDSDNEEGTTQIKLIFGTQTNDDSGFIEVFNWMERVRVLLMRQRIMEKKYCIEPEWKWKFLEDQPEPQWMCQALTTWILPQIRQEVKTI
ncbi:hypothetical protein [Cohnella nanjingensis]|uniref:Uncharacterized protein n=1 Tax=Cohnella nanjingensis TaxID=1387779 RepID=A0A7X0RQ94_9BACL|nr:hypothetical protein [Cohnella nanjingensis]MBB6670501.1 hypothetical protein [Cohnella nanjingensis]